MVPGLLGRGATQPAGLISMRSAMLAALLFAAAAAEASAALPDGPNAPLVATTCLQCHGPQPFAQLRMNQSAWRAEVENMALRGAAVGPDQIDLISHYLATVYGPGVQDPNQPRLAVWLPAGHGAVLVQAGCAICHGLQRVIAARRPGHQWAAIVHRMIGLGAPLNAAQASQVISYLEINLATGCGPVTAALVPLPAFAGQGPDKAATEPATTRSCPAGPH